MKIGWLVPTVGIFGAVREMVEVSNVLVSLGHKVTIYHPDGESCVWLPCKAATAKLEACSMAGLDVLIGIIDWKPELYELLMGSDAKVKATCLMGFDPTDELADILNGKLPARGTDMRVLRDSMQHTLVLSDSSWQLAWLEEKTGIRGGVPFGGVNLQMFKLPDKHRKRDNHKIIASGDPRARKGSDTVLAAMEIIKQAENVEFDTYWNRRFSQEQLVEFYQDADLFLDGHRRAGWCNPVAEAMACGTVSVCTNIGAVSDFAIDGKTAAVVQVDDAGQMAQAALNLLRDEKLRSRYRSKGLAQIAQYDYNLVAPRLIQCFEESLRG